jgi:hypothetical protein
MTIPGAQVRAARKLLDWMQHLLVICIAPFAAIIALLALTETAVAGDVSFSELVGHSVEYEFYDQSTYRFLDTQREFGGTGIIAGILYISNKKRIFFRITFHRQGKQDFQVVENLRALGELASGHPHWDYSPGEERIGQWKFENGAIVGTSAGNGYASRFVVDIMRAGEGLACTLDSKDFKGAGTDKIISGKTPQGRLYERLKEAISTSYCRVTEGNRLEGQ